MPDYIQGQIQHVDQLLSNVALGYSPKGFIGERILPVVRVPHEKDLYAIWTQADFFRVEDDKRSRGTEANQIGYSVSSDSYVTQNYALRRDIAEEDLANADPLFQKFNSEEKSVFLIKQALLLSMELRIANMMSSTSNVGSSTAVASSWTDYTNSNPWANITTAILNVEGATGYRPNRMLFGGLAWEHFSRNNRVIDKVYQTGVTNAAPNATIEQAKALFEMDTVLVGRTFRNTAAEGVTQSLSRIWADHVWVYYTPDGASTELPSYGYAFRWAAPGIPDMTVTRHPADTRKHITQSLEVGYHQAEKRTSNPLCFMITNATSST